MKRCRNGFAHQIFQINFAVCNKSLCKEGRWKRGKRGKNKTDDPELCIRIGAFAPEGQRHVARGESPWNRFAKNTKALEGRHNSGKCSPMSPPGGLQSPRSHAPAWERNWKDAPASEVQVEGNKLVSASATLERREIVFPRWSVGTSSMRWAKPTLLFILRLDEFVPEFVERFAGVFFEEFGIVFSAVSPRRSTW